MRNTINKQHFLLLNSTLFNKTVLQVHWGRGPPKGEPPAPHFVLQLHTETTKNI